jgi:pyruvate dehydrogenase E1 component alpha subunit
VRERLNVDADIEPAELFAHVYAHPTAALDRQRAQLMADIEDRR